MRTDLPIEEFIFEFDTKDERIADLQLRTKPLVEHGATIKEIRFPGTAIPTLENMPGSGISVNIYGELARYGGLRKDNMLDQDLARHGMKFYGNDFQNEAIFNRGRDGKKQHKSIDLLQDILDGAVAPVEMQVIYKE